MYHMVCGALVPQYHTHLCHVIWDIYKDAKLTKHLVPGMPNIAKTI